MSKLNVLKPVETKNKFRFFFASSSGIKVPLNTLVTDRPCSLMARLMTALTEEKTRFTDDEDMPRLKR